MKRFLRGTLLFLFIGGGLLAVSGWMVHRQVLTAPSWYGRPQINARARAAAANQLAQKLAGTYSAAQDARAAEIRASLRDPSQPATTQPADPVTIEASEEEINALFNEWKDIFGWNDNAGKYLRDPVVAFEDHTLILAAAVEFKNVSTIASLHFRPRVVDGKLLLGPYRVMAGTLPVPRSYFASQIQKMVDGIEANLPAKQKAADIGPHGQPNDAAVETLTAQLLAHALSDEPSEPVLFVGSGKQSLPMQIMSIDIQNKILTIVLQPMNALQRATFLQRIKQDNSKPTE